MAAVKIQRPKMSIIVLACAFVIGVSTMTQALAHEALIFRHRSVPILQFIDYTPSQEPLARKLARERYQMARQCNLEWQGGQEVDIWVLFPIGHSDRIYCFYNCWDDGSSITCYQHTKGKCRLVYQVGLVDHQRRVTKAKPVHIRAQFQTLLDYLTKDWPDDPEHPKTVNYYTLSRSANPTSRKDLALKRDYVGYTENPFNEILSVWLLSDTRRGNEVDTQYSTREDPFTKALLSEDQFYEKYGLPVTSEELHKMR